MPFVHYAMIFCRTTTPEEMDEKYERVLSSSLLCLRLVITMCPSQKLNDLTNKYTTVLSTAAFWKYASHKNSTVSMKLSWNSNLSILVLSIWLDVGSPDKPRVNDHILFKYLFCVMYLMRPCTLSWKIRTYSLIFAIDSHVTFNRNII